MNNLRVNILLPCLIALACFGFSQSSPPGSTAPEQAKAPAQKSSLHVLLVGHDPAQPRIAIPSQATARTWKLYKERTQAFEHFLKQHFETVTTVFGEDYTPAMSADVDVTLFDTRPKRIENEANNPRMSIPPDFTYPALMIGDASPLIGEPIQLKLDWL